VKRLIIILAMVAGAGGGLLAAAPAMAACTPGTGDTVNACASVSNQLTLTGLTNAIDFGNVLIGPNTVTGAENYSVITNNPSGYTLTITGSDHGLCTADEDTCVPNNNITVDETGYNAGDYTFPAAEETPLQVGSDVGGGTDSYSENWVLNLPVTTPPGDFSEAFTYAVVAG
jgi:hypothetical protein